MTQDNEEPSAASAGSLVCPYVTGTFTRYCMLTPFTLTDAEREAIQFALRRLYGTLRGNEECDHADALQGILERIA